MNDRTTVQIFFLFRADPNFITYSKSFCWFFIEV